MKLVKDLPEIFEEFGEQKRASFLEVKKYKEAGKPVIGAYCSYFPRELAMAIGAIPVGLCSSSNDTVAIAEQTLPSNICPLIKSSYGFAVSDRCPFYYFSDLVSGETTCDGKKKMYELMSDFKEVYVMELPNRQSEYGLELWRKEIIRFKEYLEERFHIVITDEMVKKAIHLSNENRRAVQRLYGLMKLDPPPMSGRELFQILYGNKYQLDLEKVPGILDQVREKILEEYHRDPPAKKKPRILITGCPMGGDSSKLVDIIEDNGGVVVAFENCTGIKAQDRLVDEETPDIYEALAERYLMIGCAIMTPNDNRIELLGRIIDEFHVDGVIEMILQGCHSDSIESISVRNFIHEEKHIPYMDVTTDFSRADIAQLSVRISAFLEML